MNEHHLICKLRELQQWKVGSGIRRSNLIDSASGPTTNIRSITSTIDIRVSDSVLQRNKVSSHSRHKEISIVNLWHPNDATNENPVADCVVVAGDSCNSWISISYASDRKSRFQNRPTINVKSTISIAELYNKADLGGELKWD
jgi:hypothetical protein